MPVDPDVREKGDLVKTRAYAPMLAIPIDPSAANAELEADRMSNVIPLERR